MGMANNIYIQSDIETFEALRDTYDTSLSSLYEYVGGKANTADWRAVSDAANDIREIQAKLEILNYVIRQLKDSLRMGQGKTGTVTDPGHRSAGISIKQKTAGIRNRAAGNHGSNPKGKGTDN